MANKLGSIYLFIYCYTVNQKFEEFILKNNRLPTQAKDEDERTFKLAKWIVRNNEEYKNNQKAMKDTNNRQMWVEFKNKYSNLFYEKINDWNQKINLVQDFINNNKRLPYENKDRGEDEYNLRIWLKTQIKIYS
jgi:hypothetical protein